MCVHVVEEIHVYWCRCNVVQNSFPGLFVSTEPPKMRVGAQMLRREMFFFALPDVTYSSVLLPTDGVTIFKSPQVLTLSGVVWFRRSWIGLTVLGEPTVVHHHLLFMVA